MLTMDDAVTYARNRLDAAFERAKAKNTSHNGGLHLADKAMYDSMKARLEKMFKKNQKKSWTEKEANEEKAFGRLMVSPVQLIGEIQIHMSWFFQVSICLAHPCFLPYILALVLGIVLFFVDAFFCMYYLC